MVKEIIEIEADTTEFDEQLDAKESEVLARTAKIAQSIRQTAELGILLAEASGVVIDETMRLYVEAGLRSIEVSLEASAVLAAGTLGISQILSLGLQAAAIASMLLTISNIQRGRTDAARRTRALAQGLRMVTYNF